VAIFQTKWSASSALPGFPDKWSSCLFLLKTKMIEDKYNSSFFGPDALSAIQPIVSKHWRWLRTLIQITKNHLMASFFFVHDKSRIQREILATILTVIHPYVPMTSYLSQLCPKMVLSKQKPFLTFTTLGQQSDKWALFAASGPAWTEFTTFYTTRKTMLCLHRSFCSMVGLRKNKIKTKQGTLIVVVLRRCHWHSHRSQKLVLLCRTESSTTDSHLLQHHTAFHQRQ